jgi:chorismate dehydratase
MTNDKSFFALIPAPIDRARTPDPYPMFSVFGSMLRMSRIAELSRRTGPYIAASSYLNTAPLIYSFIEGEQRELCRFLSDAAPARCADLLAEGTADAALIPVIEYQRIPGLFVVPGVCVSSKNKVRSVVLASRVPIEKVRSVALDVSSRTSVCLVRIILAKFYGINPEYRFSPPDITRMFESSEAALIIGDPAMLIDRQSLFVYDLAAEWRKHTGLPFVFAFWAIRRDSEDWPRPENRISFEAAKYEGMQHLDRIVDRYSSMLNLDRDDLLTYLTENINFDLDDENLLGVDLYYRLAVELGLIETRLDIVFTEDRK